MYNENIHAYILCTHNTHILIYIHMNTFYIYIYIYIYSIYINE